MVETCQLLQRLGYDGVEWRVRYTRPEAMGKGYSYWGAHKSDLSPANLAQKAPEVARIAADHGLEIAAIASNLRATELEDIKRLADGVACLSETGAGSVPIRLGAPRGYDRYVQHCHAGGWRPIAQGRRKDGTLEWGWAGCDLSDSILDIPLFLSDLEALDYQGFISIEEFRQIDHEQKLRPQIEYLRALAP